MRKLGFDPSAERQLRHAGESIASLVEVTLERADDHHLILVITDDDGREVECIRLRPAFLDEFVAQARASEQSAA